MYTVCREKAQASKNALPSNSSIHIVQLYYMTKELGIWEVAVLALLSECAMHPYQMQMLLRERHKDEILALKKGSLYHAINRLVRGELIEVGATSRDGRRPERTTYRITPAGQDELFRVLKGIIATPRRESSEFMAAMSFLVHLTPDEALPRLTERGQKLEAEIAGLSAGLEALSGWVLRINLVESEYLLAMLRAELGWVRALADDVREGRLEWDLQRIIEEINASKLKRETVEGGK
jgi:DNA-binding PadR family transcriptional regulator